MLQSLGMFLMAIEHRAMQDQAEGARRQTEQVPVHLCHKIYVKEEQRELEKMWWYWLYWQNYSCDSTAKITGYCLLGGTG